MNIAIDIRALGKRRTGDEVYIHMIVKALLRENKPHYTYFLFTDNPQWHELDLLRVLPSHIRVICLLPAHKVLWTMFLLPRACHRYKIDVLHVMYITPLFGLPDETRLVTTIHDISWKFVPEYIKKKDRFLLNVLVPLSVRKANLILTVSKHAAESIHHIFHVPRTKIKAIYNGGFLGKEPVPLTLSQSVQDSIGQDYIVYLGSLQPRKNIPALIDGFAHFKSQYPQSSLKLIIAGGKGYNYDHKIDEAIMLHNLDREIIQLGFVSESEKYALLKHAKGFFFLSLYEGFGIPAIEAMSLKTLTVVSDRSCLPEIVQDGALIVDPDIIEEVSKAIYKAAYPGNNEKEMVGRGLRRAHNFQWETMQQEILDTYISL